jgi:hypothetical protein
MLALFEIYEFPCIQFLRISIGTGKTTVVFFSTPISVKVCRYRNGRATGSLLIMPAASASSAVAWGTGRGTGTRPDRGQHWPAFLYHAVDPKVAEYLHISEAFEHAAEFDLIHSHHDFMAWTCSRKIPAK